MAMYRHCILFGNFYESLDKEVKVSSSQKVNREIKVSIFGIFSFDSFLLTLFNYYHLYSFNITYTVFNSLILLHNNVRKSVLHSKAGNSIVQDEK
jgi:hypothetical protein